MSESGAVGDRLRNWRYGGVLVPLRLRTEQAPRCPARRWRITLAERAIESFLPADRATAEALRLAAAR